MVLCCTVLYYVVLYYTALNSVILWCTEPYCTVLQHALLVRVQQIIYSTMVLCCTVLCYVVLYYTALNAVILWCTEPYCTVLQHSLLIREQQVLDSKKLRERRISKARRDVDRQKDLLDAASRRVHEIEVAHNSHTVYNRYVYLKEGRKCFI